MIANALLLRKTRTNDGGCKTFAKHELLPRAGKRGAVGTAHVYYCDMSQISLKEA